MGGDVYNYDVFYDSYGRTNSPFTGYGSDYAWYVASSGTIGNLDGIDSSYGFIRINLSIITEK